MNLKEVDSMLMTQLNINEEGKELAYCRYIPSDGNKLCA